MSVRIITDSAADFTQEEAAALGLEIIPLTVMMNGEIFRDGIDLTPDVLYARMAESEELPTTSQLTPIDFENKFKEVVDAGDTAVCICISSGLSGTFGNAKLLEPEFEGKIHVFDSLTVSLGQRVHVMRALELRNEGKSADEIFETLEAEKPYMKTVAVLDTLTNLRKGGRIPAGVAIAGNFLQVKACIYADKEGKIGLLTAARGFKAGLKKMDDFISKFGGINQDRPICAAYSAYGRDPMFQYLDSRSELIGRAADQVPYTQIGSAVGVHAGPGTVGIAFYCNKL